MRISDWSSDVCSSDLSATGLVLADVRHDLVRMLVCDLATADRDRLMTALEELGREASLALDGERVPMDRRSHVYSVDLRRSEEHTSELQSLMRNSYAVFCLKKKNNQNTTHNTKHKVQHE